MCEKFALAFSEFPLYHSTLVLYFKVLIHYTWCGERQCEITFHQPLICVIYLRVDVITVPTLWIE